MIIKLTELARKELERILKEDDQGVDLYLRVKVQGGGCSGFTHKLAFDPQYDETKDKLEEHDGIKVVIDKRSALYLEGTTIDFADSLNARGFVFLNDTIKSRCGCGSSFSM
jgi:iron-sulfur cluster assembly protein